MASTALKPARAMRAGRGSFAELIRALPAGTARLSRELVDFLDPARGSLIEPMAAESLTTAAISSRARTLAAAHDAAPARGDGGAALIARLRRNVGVLRDAAAVLEHDIEPGVYASPAATWLTDNVALVDEQLEEVTDSLPAGWFRRLPVLKEGEGAGTPRVLDIAWAWLPASGQHFEPALLDAFFDGYQSLREPTWGEWWALAPVLRLVLVEQLRRLAERVAVDKAARTLAHAIAAGPQPAPAVLGRLIDALRKRSAERAFLLQLHASTRDAHYDTRHAEPGAVAAIEPPGGWALHLPLPAVARQAQQAADAAHDADVAEAVRSLHAVARFRWREWIARRSVLAGTLRQLPAFADEDEATQNRTLHAIESWSRRTQTDELQVARDLVERVASVPRGTTPPPAPWEPTLAARWPRARLALYLGVIALATSAFVVLALPKQNAWPAGLGWIGTLLLSLLIVLPASEIAVSSWHRLLCEWLPPRRLPRLAWDDGIPQVHRVLVVMPCLLGRDAGIDALATQIERHHLASNEAWAQYGLLSDYSDAASETLLTDEPQLARARAAIEALNTRYAALPDGAPRFLLLHRRRVWSAEEGRWMGWERKRGKIEQLVSQLADAACAAAVPGAFIDLAALSKPVSATPYIVVLDSDTLLPPGTLRSLVSIAAHPSNTPRVDARLRRVVEGHGVLQPRVALPLPTPGSSTLFHTLTAGFSGLDPYAAATSEVYEDLFDEGSFSGKGLLHVQAAHAVLHGRLPTAQVLSHDLLEGALLRCASAGDVALLEGAPVHPDVADSRLHRWTRGDWQLLPFIARPRFWSVTPLNLWKMLDNLRRSLVVPASVALLLVSAAGGWPALPMALLLVLGAIGAGPMVGAMAAFSPSDDRLALRPLARHAVGVLLRALGSIAWQFAQLLQQALLLLDAITRALVRQFVTHRKLLSWTTAAAAEAAASRDARVLWRRHRRTSAVAALLAMGLIALPGPVSFIGLLLCLLWGLSPLWTWAAAQPLAAPVQEALPPEALDDLHDVARETWRYFQRHVSAATHHLPPDNHQRVPHPQTACNTSPTNIGMYLTATLCAWRFGFIGHQETRARIAATLATVQSLPKHRGHLFNWIDTRTLAVLPPAYTSTVDSGNLCAALIAVAQGLREMATAEGRALSAAAATATLARDAAHLALAREQRLLNVAEVNIDGDRDTTEQALEAVIRRLRAFDEESALDGAPPQAQEMAWWRLADHLTTLQSLALDAAAAAADQPDIEALATQAEALAWATEFGWLYDRDRCLLHIGALHDGEQLDLNHYDLLASEARIASLLAIAKGDVPMRHWARLERATFAHGDRVGLRSWSGSMFEYLMPTIWIDEPEGSLLHSAAEVAVREQRLLGGHWHLPWGVSESAHAERDATLAYQYGPQGAPQLALRRTPAGERVIAPYATLLAAQVAPIPAWRNLRRLARRCARDRFGFIEALDYTPSRQLQDAPAGATRRVATFMAHHQGMALASLANVLHDGVLRRWFMSHPRVRAVSPLLHEPVPSAVRPLRPTPPLLQAGQRDDDGSPGPVLAARELQPGLRAVEPTALLANGRYAVMLNPDGSGASRWAGLAVTRWRDDALRRQHGSFFFLRWSDQTGEDGADGSDAPWCSLTQHPAPAPNVEYRCEWQPHAASFSARAPGWSATTRVWVAPEDDVERREVTLTLADAVDRTATLEGHALQAVELASYFEVALAAQAADEAHPAFANLFVSARWDAAQSALWFERRGRLEGDQSVHAVHFLAAVEAPIGSSGGIRIDAVTDRAHAIGRGRSVASPQRTAQAQAADTGTDPVASIGVRVELAPGQSLTLHFATAVAHDTETLQRVIERHRERSHVDRAWRMATTLAAIGLREAGLGVGTAQAWSAWQALTTPLATRLSRALPVLEGAQAHEGLAAIDRRALWRLGLSGERPLLLLRVPAADGLPLAEWLLRTTPLWARAGLGVDVVLLNTEAASYLQPVQQGLTRLAHRFEADAARPFTSPCKLLVVRAEDLSPLEAATLRRLARLDLRADGRPVQAVLREWRSWHASELERRQTPLSSALPWLPASAAGPEAACSEARFDADTGACAFTVSSAQRPPRPWVNVLANPAFGTQVTEAGGGHTWAHNSRQLQITPWSNDPLCDPAGEWLLLQDTVSGQVWNLFPSPAGAAPVAYAVEQGPGWTSVSHTHLGVAVELQVVVDPATAIKQTLLHLRCDAPGERRLRLIAVAQWQMGEHWGDRAGICTHAQWLPADASSQTLDEEAPQRALVLHATQTDAGCGFGLSTAFLALRPGTPQPRWAFDWTADRRELFDARGAAVLPDDFGGRSGAGLDPCAALSLPLTLHTGRTQSFTVLLGHDHSPSAARRLAQQAVSVDPADRAAHATGGWRQRQSALSVSSPDPLFDVLVNHWLRYQTLACRVWARAGFYQAGGAFGFRDQLQDTMALTDVDGSFLREQIVLAASRQFAEGDVQHWWHPPQGAGVRTRFSDDLLWLVAALLRHLDTGGDVALLEVEVPFLQGRSVPEGAEDVYETPVPSDDTVPVWEHAARALDRSLAFGEHGLPLIGSGDWNDGMNRVGIHGRGESVWLAWFQLTLLEPMAARALQRGEGARAASWRAAAASLSDAVQSAGWDGAWYRRAYFDDGSTLGSAANAECRIDLIAQAWAVLALPEAGTDSLSVARARQAMRSAAAYLFDDRADVLRLLYPPLQHQQPSAGYIQAYPPGVRENGGQYSHAAAWASMAFAQLGDASQAWRAWRSVSPAHRHQHGAATYGLEPYAVAGDVYADAPWAGRGGWSWYTGAAGWLYRAAVESLLGVHRNGNRVQFAPTLPPGWPSACVTLRCGALSHRFHIGPQAELGAPASARTLARGQVLDLATLTADSDWLLPTTDVALRSERAKEVA